MQVAEQLTWVTHENTTTGDVKKLPCLSLMILFLGSIIHSRNLPLFCTGFFLSFFQIKLFCINNKEELKKDSPWCSMIKPTSVRVWRLNILMISSVAPDARNLPLTATRRTLPVWEWSAKVCLRCTFPSCNIKTYLNCLHTYKE